MSSDRSEIVRGDWTPLELFLAGVQGWEAALRRLLDVAWLEEPGAVTDKRELRFGPEHRR